MLNVKKLSELLLRNVDPRLYPRLFVMSPNGTLLAYSKPVDIRELRDQAALVSMTWKEHETDIAHASKTSDADGTTAGSDSSRRSLETLTIEFETNSLIVRAVQPNLLLVIVGAVLPGTKPSFKMTPEKYGDTRYPPNEASSSAGLLTVTGTSSLRDGSSKSSSTLNEDSLQLSKSPAESHMSQRDKDVKVGLLHIQRKKIDALTKYLRAELDARGFTMPDDGAFP